MGRETSTGAFVKNADCCFMCKRVVINSGVNKVVIREDKENYKIIDVDNWIDYDEVLEEQIKPLVEGKNE